MKSFTTKKIEKLKKKIIVGKKLKKSQSIFYGENKNLKKENIHIKYTEYENEEYLKSFSNKQYFIEKYLKIKIYDYKIDILNHYEENKYIIFMNSKEIGFTKILSALLIYEMIFNLEYFVQIYDKLKENRIHIFVILKNLYEKLPFFLQVGVIRWTIDSIYLENKNGINIDTITEEPSFRKNINILIINDMSNVDDKLIRSFYSYLIPSIEENTSKIILISTPNGKGLFSEIVLKLKNPTDKKRFSILKTYWNQVHGRDLKWKENKIKSIDCDEPEIYFQEKYDLEILDERLKKLYRILY